MTIKGVYRLKGMKSQNTVVQPKTIVNLLKLDEGETIQTVINAKSGQASENNHLVFVTRQGLVKRTNDLRTFVKNGLIALKLRR